MTSKNVFPALLVSMVAGLLAATAGFAQTTTCKTGNCTAGVDGGGNPLLPPECQNIASPKIFDVNMTASPFRFVPSVIRLEGESGTPGVPWAHQCIRWHKVDSPGIPWHSATENTGGSGCNTSTTCSSTNTTPPCDFETGNIDGTTGVPLEWSVCHYKKVPPAVYPFICRLHSGLGMTGSLTTVPPIRLTVGKSGTSVVLDWAVGGVGPWNVLRDTSAPMPGFVNLTAGGTASRTLTDTTPPSPAAFYLVLERN